MKIDRREAHRRRRQKQVKRQLCLIVTGIVVVTAVFVVCGSIVKKHGEKKAEESARIEETEEGKDLIEEILETDEYGTDLAALYQRYPQTEELLLDRESYPDWLIEYFIGHGEAVEWVLDYPEYAEKTTEEINQEALAAVDLKDYQIRNGIPFYLQWNKTWGYASYGNGIIAIDGCGPTCLSMVATGLTGDTSLTPKKVADFSVENGYYVEDSVTDWSLMQKGAAQLGLTVREMNSWSKSALIGELSEGHPIICSMGPGEFTTQGHFIVLVGVTEDGMVIVNDPNSRITSRKKWDAQTLLDQMKGMWAYSVE